MTKRAAVLVLVAGAIQATLGCSSSGGGSGAIQCSPQSTCPSNLVCSQGYCVQPATGGSGGSGATGGVGTGGTGATGGANVGGSAGGDPVAAGKTWPPPNGGGPGTGAPMVIAVREMFLGDSNRSFVESTEAWKEFGYNVDGILSTSTGNNHCKLRQGVPKTLQEDGPEGIDNSYGANIVPIMSSLSAGLSQSATQAIQDGSYTFLFRMLNLDSNPNQSSVNAKFYHAAELGLVPKWDGSDAWPVVPELLTNPNDIESSLFQFPTSYVANGMWVSGNGSGTLDISLDLSGSGILLRITHPVVTMTIAPNGNVTDGIIAGVIPTESFVLELKKLAGSFDPSLCSGPTMDSIVTQIRQASDIMQDGTNGDPNVECDGISVGLGFNGSLAVLGGIAPSTPPLPDPCANP